MVDLTKHLRAGDIPNMLSISTESYQPNTRWYSGGGLFRIGDGVAAAECWGGSVILKELLSCQQAEAAQAVLTALHADCALVRTVLPGTPKPFGVVQWLDKETQRRWNQGQSRYLALAFD